MFFRKSIAIEPYSSMDKMDTSHQEHSLVERSLSRVCQSKGLKAPEYTVYKLLDGYGASVNHSTGIAMSLKMHPTEAAARQEAAQQALKNLNVSPEVSNVSPEVSNASPEVSNGWKAKTGGGASSGKCIINRRFQTALLNGLL